MNIRYVAGTGYWALTATKTRPSLYKVCGPLLACVDGGHPHLHRFYKTALGNPALRSLLLRAGLSELCDGCRFRALRQALIAARDGENPDWDAIGRPVAELLDTVQLRHPTPEAAAAPDRAPGLLDVEVVIRTCGAHLLRSFGKNGFIPTYAAFNLIGDPDVRGREFMMALTGLNSRRYKNSTLPFNLARVLPTRIVVGVPR